MTNTITKIKKFLVIVAFLQNLITKDHEAVLEMISKHIEKSWKHKNINRHFVNIVCKLHSFKRNILDYTLTQVRFETNF